MCKKSRKRANDSRLMFDDTFFVWAAHEWGTPQPQSKFWHVYFLFSHRLARCLQEKSEYLVQLLILKSIFSSCSTKNWCERCMNEDEVEIQFHSRLREKGIERMQGEEFLWLHFDDVYVSTVGLTARFILFSFAFCKTFSAHNRVTIFIQRFLIDTSWCLKVVSYCVIKRASFS